MIRLNRIIKIMLIWLIVSTIILTLISSLATYSQNVSKVFSRKTMMEELWNSYVFEYVEVGSYRTVDRQRNNITTSEGQSYTMLRAVWMDDKKVFDKSLKWTKDNLMREEDNLFSWLYGDTGNGAYDILVNQGGYNTASDGDIDIALSLIFAYSRWSDEAYLKDAKGILASIWEKEVVNINGVNYLAANNLEKDAQDEVIVNLSYLAPYSFRVFAKLDPSRPWGTLVDSTYDLLERAAKANLDKESTSGLFPDWVFLDKKTGEFRNSYATRNLSSNYSYDAMRIPWRIAIDYIWNQEPRAKSVLNNLNLLDNEYRSYEKLYASYSHDGQPVADYEDNAMYATFLGYYLVNDPIQAESYYVKRLESLYSADTNRYKRTLSYYDDNMVWFAMGLHNNITVDLSKNIFK